MGTSPNVFGYKLHKNVVAKVPNKKNQSLKNFKISKKSTREPWYKWQPEKYDNNGHLNTEDFPYKWRDTKKW